MISSCNDRGMKARALTKLLHIARVAPKEGARSVLSSKQDLAGNGPHRFPPGQDICRQRTNLLRNAEVRSDRCTFKLFQLLCILSSSSLLHGIRPDDFAAYGKQVLTKQGGL